MPMSNNAYKYNTETGFTLVEILVALVILLLIATACFPLFTLASKTTHENKARMIAAELAKRQLERTLAQVTTNNYGNEGTDPDTAPLTSGVSATFYFDDDGNYSANIVPGSRFARFQARKIVEWVDDPADGLHPTDKIPFDYKVLIIEVACPSLFTGNVTKQADFKTFVAREGSTSAQTGVIVEVVRGWTDEDGNRIPLEGATVSLDGSGPSQTAMTNASGQALIPITFPDDNTVYSYEVQTEYSGMIMRPDQDGAEVAARPYTTNSVQVEMEIPATLTLKFAPGLDDVAVTLDGGTTMGVTTKTLAAGNSKLTFTDLWPAGTDQINAGKVCEGGTYSLNIDPLLVYTALPDTGSLYPVSSDEEGFNRWTYQDNYNGGSAAWVASADNYPTEAIINPSSPHRLSFPELIDIRSFNPPASSNITADLTGLFSDFSLSAEYSELSNDFPLVYLGEENATLSSGSDDWKSLILAGNLNSSGQFADEIPIDNAYLTKSFQLRIDSDARIGTFYFRDFNIYCEYSGLGDIHFTEPGHNLTVKVSGK